MCHQFKRLLRSTRHNERIFIFRENLCGTVPSPQTLVETRAGARYSATLRILVASYESCHFYEHDKYDGYR